MPHATPITPRLVPFEICFSAEVSAVIRDVFAEYGFTWNDHPYFNDLKDIHAAYFDVGGMFWVLLDSSRVIGTVGVTPNTADECELHRLYLHRDYRGRRLGQRMLDAALDWSRGRGFRRMIAWSDVKLLHAHRMYRDNGFVSIGERTIDDPDNSHEYGFAKQPL